MKNLLTLFFAMIISASMYGQNAIEKFFSDYENDPSFSVVYVSPKMFKMVSKLSAEDAAEDSEVSKVIKNLKGLTVLSSDTNGEKLYAEALRKIPAHEYEELVKVRNKDENVKILTKNSDDDNIVHELLILVGGLQEFTLVSFVGDINLNDISKLAEKIDIKGAEHLKEVGDK